MSLWPEVTYAKGLKVTLSELQVSLATPLLFMINVRKLKEKSDFQSAARWLKKRMKHISFVFKKDKFNFFT